MIHIIDWDKYFEKAQTRKAKSHNWVAMPNSHGGRGYRRMMKQQNGIEIFGAWMLLVQLASKAPRRGYLADENGDAYTVEDLEVYTDCPKEVFERAIPFLCVIGWISESTTTVIPPCYHSDTSVVATTGHNITEQDITEQNNTEHEKPKSENISRLPNSCDVYNTRGNCDEAWGHIPRNRQRGKSKFGKAWIEFVIWTDTSPEMVFGKFKDYYDSDEGKGEYHRTPARLVEDEFWNEDPSVWSNKAVIEDAAKVTATDNWLKNLKQEVDSNDE